MSAPTRTLVVGMALALAAAGVGSCGLREDEAPRPIPREELDDRLFEGEAASSVAGGDVAIFVLTEVSGTTRLARVTVDVPPGQTRERAALDALLSWTATDGGGPGPSLTSRIPTGARLRDVRLNDGILTVDVADFPLDGPGAATAAAQVVWTAMALPGVDGVVLTVDGRPVAVPLGERTTAAPGQPLEREDFARLGLGPAPTTTAPPRDPAPATVPTSTSSVPGAAAG